MKDRLSPDALDPEDDTIPVSPARRRFQTAVGLLIVVLILGALIWFSANNTETDQGPIQLNPPKAS
jgi:hypothetical protein